MFIKNKLLLLAFLPLLFLLISCSETPNDVGADLLNQDQVIVNTINTADNNLPVTSSSFKRKISLGTAARIMIGKAANVEAGTLIKFSFSLPDTLSRLIRNDSILVENSWINLYRNYNFGSSDQPFDIEIYNITSGWTTSGFIADSLPLLQYETVNQNIGSQYGDTTVLRVQPQMILSWLEAAADTGVPDDNGAYFKASAGTNKIAGYYAIASSDFLAPALYVVMRKTGGDLDTLTYPAFTDVSVVTGELSQPGPERMVVQGGLEASSRVEFNLDTIPMHAIINKAEIVLTPDTLLSVHGDNYTNALVATFVIDTVSYDSLTSSVLLNHINGTYRGDVTGFVQEWVSKRNNNGVLISAAGRLNSVELFTLYDAAASPALRPKLIITYTVKK